MNDTPQFEWDTEKAVTNYANHGVSFDDATKVFWDLFGIEELDDREDYGEERLIRIGMVENRLLTVVYTEREERIRIISARRATKREQENYYSQYAQGRNGR